MDCIVRRRVEAYEQQRSSVVVRGECIQVQKLVGLRNDVAAGAAAGGATADARESQVRAGKKLGKEGNIK